MSLKLILFDDVNQEIDLHIDVVGRLRQTRGTLVSKYLKTLVVLIFSLLTIYAEAQHECIESAHERIKGLYKWQFRKPGSYEKDSLTYPLERIRIHKYLLEDGILNYLDCFKYVNTLEFDFKKNSKEELDSLLYSDDQIQKINNALKNHPIKGLSINARYVRSDFLEKLELEQLESLSITFSDSSITTSDSCSLRQYKNLRVLGLHYGIDPSKSRINFFSYFPNTIEEIYISSYVELNDFPSNLSNLNSVTNVTLENMTYIPEEIYTYSNLKYLEINNSFVGLNKINPNFNQLKDLVELRIHDIGDIDSINQDLFIENKNLRRITIDKAANLKYVDLKLNNCYLSIWSHRIEKLSIEFDSALTTNISGNYLQHVAFIPNNENAVLELVVAHCPNLKTIKGLNKSTLTVLKFTNYSMKRKFIKEFWRPELRELVIYPVSAKNLKNNQIRKLRKLKNLEKFEVFRGCFEVNSFFFFFKKCKVFPTQNKIKKIRKYTPDSTELKIYDDVSEDCCDKFEPEEQDYRVY